MNDFQERIDNVERLRAGRILSLDYETQSKIDLPKHGVYRYAMDPSTKILCAKYRFNDEDTIRQWVPAEEPMPQDFRDHIEGGGLVVAYNATFERLITKHVAGLEVTVWQFACTAAQARVCALPHALGQVSKCLGLASNKDSYGASLINQYSLPRAETGELVPWGEIPEGDQEAWLRYCEQDVVLEGDLASYLLPMSDREVAEYQIWEQINDAGVCVDLTLARDIIELSDAVRAEVNAKLAVLTDGVVESHTSQKGRYAWLIHGYGLTGFKGKWAWISNDTQRDKLPKYVQARTLEPVDPVLCESEVAYLRKPVKVDQEEGDVTFDKRWRADLMAAHNSDLITLDARAFTFFELLDEAGGATISKYSSAIDRAQTEGDEDIVRGIYMFSGAGQTGRLSSKGVQLHNLKRDGFPNHDDIIDLIHDLAQLPEAERDFTELEALSGQSVMTTFAWLVRNMLWAADGYKFVWGDWSSIEARVQPWLANSAAGEAKLQDFRDGVDPYIVNASASYGVAMEDVTSDQRQTGKVQELSLGFAGGPGALASMARGFGIKYHAQEAIRLRDGWRAANPWAPVFWNAVETAAWDAMRNPGRAFPAGRLLYRFFPEVMGGSLVCMLPSGRHLTYPGARIESIYNKNFDDYVESITSIAGSVSQKQGDRAWPRKSLWRGTLAENCIAAGTDVLTDAGWLPIQYVRPHHKIHDGVDFVNHAGLLDKGEQLCITLDGVDMTPDHEVLDDDQTFQTAETSPRLYRPNLGDADCRESAFDPPDTARETQMALDVSVRVRQGRGEDAIRCEKSEATQLRMPEVDGSQRAHARYDEASSLPGVAQHGRPLPAVHTPGMAQLRRPRYFGLRCVGALRAVLAGYGARLRTWFDTGSHRQRAGVFPGELQVGYLSGAGAQQAQQSDHLYALGAHDRVRSERALRCERDYDTVQVGQRLGSHDDSVRTTQFQGSLQKRRVFDILNCGPRHRFVVRGDQGAFIVSNCTQAVAADILREAVIRIHSEDTPVVLTTHDEIVISVADDATGVEEWLASQMNVLPDWAEGLPLAVKTDSGFRYSK